MRNKLVGKYFSALKNDSLYIFTETTSKAINGIALTALNQEIEEILRAEKCTQRKI